MGNFEENQQRNNHRHRQDGGKRRRRAVAAAADLLEDRDRHRLCPASVKHERGGQFIEDGDPREDCAGNNARHHHRHGHVEERLHRTIA